LPLLVKGFFGLKFFAIIMQYLYCMKDKGTKAYL
jgi:hypothetical protein